MEQIGFGLQTSYGGIGFCELCILSLNLRKDRILKKKKKNRLEFAHSYFIF